MTRTYQILKINEKSKKGVKGKVRHFKVEWIETQIPRKGTGTTQMTTRVVSIKI